MGSIQRKKLRHTHDLFRPLSDIITKVENGASVQDVLVGVMETILRYLSNEVNPFEYGSYGSGLRLPCCDPSFEIESTIVCEFVGIDAMRRLKFSEGQIGETSKCIVECKELSKQRRGMMYGSFFTERNGDILAPCLRPVVGEYSNHPCSVRSRAVGIKIRKMENAMGEVVNDILFSCRVCGRQYCERVDRILCEVFCVNVTVIDKPRQEERSNYATGNSVNRSKQKTTSGTWICADDTRNKNLAEKIAADNLLRATHRNRADVKGKICKPYGVEDVL